MKETAVLNLPRERCPEGVPGEGSVRAIWQTLVNFFSTDPAEKISIAVMIAIEMLIRINQTLPEIF